VPIACPTLSSTALRRAGQLACHEALMHLLRGKHEGLNRGNADPTAAG